MNTSQYHDLVRQDDIEDAVRKATQQGASDVERLQKPVTKLATSLPVPRNRVVDVGFGGVPEAKIHFLRFNSSRT